MRVVLLTTETTHHVYFASRLAERHALCGIVAETRAVEPPFPVAHPYEERRDAFEREVVLEGTRLSLADVADVVTTPSVNDAIPALRDLRPDVVIVFGTGRLRSEAIEVASTACLNLHGGDPERYRGLDSHLWAIYHREFDALVATLHHVDAGLDTGDIVGQAPVLLAHGMELHELRAATTCVCVELSLGALDVLEAGGPAVVRQQESPGRYYSFMPAVLKELCVERFRLHTSAL